MCKNVPDEIFLVWFKCKTKLSSCSGLCVQGEWQKHTPSSPLLSKDEGLKDIGHSMNIGKLILGVNSVTVSYLIRYDSLLQNATDIITKCDRFVITNCDSFIIKCNGC